MFGKSTFVLLLFSSLKTFAKQQQQQIKNTFKFHEHNIEKKKIELKKCNTIRPVQYFHLLWLPVVYMLVFQA